MISRAVTIAAVLMSVPLIAAADDWPCFQHDPQHTGVTPCQVKLPLKMLWEKSIGWSSSQAIAVGGRLYLGNWKGEVLCLDQQTGETLWTYATGGPVLFSACVNGGKVFIGSQDGFLYALSAEGKLLWRYQTGGPIWSSPVAAGGLVFCGSKDGWLYALKAEDGSPAWKYNFGSPVWSSPAWHDGKVFCGSKLGRCAALDAATGKEVWRFQTLGWMANNSLTIVGGKVFVTSLNRTYLPESGEWHIWVQGSDTLEKVLARQGNTQCVYALEESTGKVLWGYPSPEQVLGKPVQGELQLSAPTAVYTCPGNTPAVANGRVYLDVCSYPFDDGDRPLLVLSADNGQVVAKSTDTSVGLFADAVVAGNIVLSGPMCMMRGLIFRPDGSMLDCRAFGATPGIDPASWGGAQFRGDVSCVDGRLFAVGLVRHGAPGGAGYIRAFSFQSEEGKP